MATTPRTAGDAAGDEAEIDFCDVPDSMKGHRACLRCGLVKVTDQFYEKGCENCPFLDMQDRMDRVTMHTTANFDGVVAMINPDDSWVAKWEGLKRFYPGVYAVKVYGQLPSEAQDFLDERGLACRAQPEDEE
mmetsp:Transcript_24488/g.97174  ORF Transcript_24488/g.97174 Transcript_24488/m.97174 type:complete len:133 (+) Transcript_24488:37-435(+)